MFHAVVSFPTALRERRAQCVAPAVRAMGREPSLSPSVYQHTLHESALVHAFRAGTVDIVPNLGKRNEFLAR